MLRFGAAVLLFVVACLEPQLVLCGDGRACPQGTTCQVTLETCVSDDQQTACAGIDNGQMCDLDGVPGTCVEGACFEQRCGDRIIEQGEACDDGNFTSGDGCSADCRSDEVCGDGIFEPELGEVCDDGNSASGDGCSSACEPERIEWRVRQCGTPVETKENNTAFDAKRGVLVVADAFWLWEWNGSEWSCVPIDPRPDGNLHSIVLAYDPVREVVMSFEYNFVRSWNGTSWTVLSTDGDFEPMTVAYDSLRDRFFGWSPGLTTKTMVWNPVSRSWGEVAVTSAAYPMDRYVGVSAYDPIRDEVVALLHGYSPLGPLDTWVWKPGAQTWTQRVQSWEPRQGVAVTSHPTLGVVAFGGYDGSTPLSTLYRWDSGSWEIEATTADSQIARSNAGFAYDPATSTLLATGPFDVIRFANGAWTRWQPTGLLSPGIESKTIVSNPADRSLIASNGSQTWRYDGSAWSEVPAVMPPPPFITYRPDTQRVVGYAADRGMLELSGSDWVIVEAETWPNTIESLAWVPGRGLVLYDLTGLYARGATGWEKFADKAPGYGAQLLYDYTTERLLVMTRGEFLPETKVFDLLPTGWHELFKFTNSGDFEARTIPGRGTPLFVEPNGGRAWELIDGAWRHHLDGFPAGMYMDSAGTDWATGEVLVQARDTAITIGIGYTSGRPRESCVDSEDLDTDGKSGCDDDDCWWRCEPTCPPASSCF